MKTSRSFQALRRANPRTKPGFARSVESAAEAVPDADRRQRLWTSPWGEPRFTAPGARSSACLWGRRLSLAAASAVVAFLTVGSPGGGPGVQDAAAAVEEAANVTAASAEHSGTAVVQISHNSEIKAGAPCAGTTETWPSPATLPRRAGEGRVGHPRRRRGVFSPRPGDGGWVVLGRPENVDSGTGTTAAEHVEAVREDIGGATLRRLDRRGDDGADDESARRRLDRLPRHPRPRDSRPSRPGPRKASRSGCSHSATWPRTRRPTLAGLSTSRSRSVPTASSVRTSSSGGPAAPCGPTRSRYSGLGSTSAPLAPARPRGLLKERFRR